jgi:hypothetical protein
VKSADDGSARACIFVMGFGVQVRPGGLVFAYGMRKSIVAAGLARRTQGAKA